MKKTFAAAISAAVIAVSAFGGVAGGYAGTAYAADGHTHTFSQVWSKGEVNHWHSSECGDNIVRDIAPHTYGADNACTVCGYVKQGEHTHRFNTSAWVNDGLNHWHAAVCGHDVVTDIARHEYDSDGLCFCGFVRPEGNHRHIFSHEWSSDKLNHWKSAECGHQIVSEMAAHNVDSKGVCSVCKTRVTEEKPIELPENISAAGGYSESLYAEWKADGIKGVKAYYRESGSTKWLELDENLIRFNGGVARVDAVGLNEGIYELKITNGNSDMLVKNISVAAYDRSGYAHFNYSDGVGAYNDDGSLKDGALVIYVTDANKNDISDYVYKNTENGLVKEDISQYLWNGHKGIGYILNNRGYENNAARENYGIQKLSFTYGAVAVRILDNVNAEVSPAKEDAGKSLIEGLTAYNSTENGGSVGDNGRMARITNAKNLTIEGIGESAGMYGWGVHFVSNDNLHKTNYEAGKGFEVRNITFEHYPEDAIGMEGTQGSKVDPNTGSITSGDADPSSPLVSPVQRCWIHNNVFKPGYCKDPAESDKAEGDGSCDFKRGRYYTLSYNYFADCHKTNLVGSSKSSVTYDVTMHHNWWNNCGARQPLARRANIHFYNNYISGDMSATPKPALSYVTSMRAATYIFMEANYYDGCKSVVEDGGEGGGSAAKSWNNVYYACFNGDASTHVNSRTETVANSCKFIAENIDYSKFDTDPALFYYDKVNQKSDCELDDALTARVKVMQNAGVNGFGKSAEEIAFNKYVPSKAIQLAESGETVINLPAAKDDTEVNGVLFRGLTGASGGTVKGKGQIITFTVPAGGAVVTVTTTSASGDGAPEFVGADGKVWASKFTGTFVAELPAGTYFIASGQKDKESIISALSFASTAESSALRVQAAIDAISAIPENVTVESEALIHEAQTAYSGLLESERANFDAALKAKLETAVNTLDKLKADAVIALIDALGEITQESGDKITAAQKAYNSLSAEQKAMVTNVEVLFAAENAYAAFAVTNFKNTVDALVDVSTLGVSDRAAIEKAKRDYSAAYETYENFGEERRAEIERSYVEKLESALEKLARYEKLFEFKDALGAVTAENVTLTDGAALQGLYNGLDGEQKAALSEEENAKYAELMHVYEEIKKNNITCTFLGGTPSNEVFVSTGTKQNQDGSAKVVNAYGGQLASGLKLEDGTKIEFTIQTKMVLKLYLKDAGKKVKIGGVNYTSAPEGGDNVITVELEAGTYAIEKNNPATLYFATLSPAA